MSGRGLRMDERIARTVPILLQCPGLSVPEVMRACKFSLDESINIMKQMEVRQSFAKATGGNAVALSPNVIDTTVGTLKVLPLTNQTTAVRCCGTPMTPTTPPMTTSTPPRTPTAPTTPGGTQTTRPKPKQKLIRKSVGALQK